MPQIEISERTLAMLDLAAQASGGLSYDRLIWASCVALEELMPTAMRDRAVANAIANGVDPAVFREGR